MITLESLPESAGIISNWARILLPVRELSPDPSSWDLVERLGIAID